MREGDVSGDEHQWSRVVLFLFLIFLEREEGHDLSQTLRELYVPVVHKRGVASHKDTTHRLQTHNHTVICVPLRCFYIMLSFFFFFFSPVYVLSVGEGESFQQMRRCRFNGIGFYRSYRRSDQRFSILECSEVALRRENKCSPFSLSKLPDQLIRIQLQDVS